MAWFELARLAVFFYCFCSFVCVCRSFNAAGPVSLRTGFLCLTPARARIFVSSFEWQYLRHRGLLAASQRPRPPPRPEPRERAQSQEFSSSLAALERRNANGDASKNGSDFRHADAGEARRAGTTGGAVAETEEVEDAVGRACVSSLLGGSGRGRGERQQQRRGSRSTTSTASGMDEQAGREISDIDRRLGELHEFLKRAKEGGLGALPLPPPPPPATTESQPSQPTSVVDSFSATRPPPAAATVDEGERLSEATVVAAESAVVELREEESPSPPAADRVGHAGGSPSKGGGSRSIDEDGADAVCNWQEGGGAGDGSEAGSGAWRGDDIEEE